MKLLTTAATLLSAGILTASVIAAEPPAATSATDAVDAKKMALDNKQQKVSYAIGVNIGESFSDQAVDVLPDVVAQGITDAMQGEELLLNKEEMQTVMQEFQQDLAEKKEAEFKMESTANLEVGDKFQQQYKVQKDVKTSDSGLMYKVVKKGDGEMPKDTDSVTVHYEGKLVNGKVFDSSYERGQPVTFQVTQVIPGWTEALKMMKKGAEWEVVIPPQLAYGEQGAGGLIGPNQTLVFKIELIDIDANAGGEDLD
jgi:FKBP-type peptidyl-prolyl cis-trans isomerase FklB